MSLRFYLMPIQLNSRGLMLGMNLEFIRVISSPLLFFCFNCSVNLESNSKGRVTAFGTLRFNQRRVHFV